MRHRLARIRRDVHERELQFDRIGPHAPQIGRQFERHGNGRMHRGLHELEHAAQPTGGIDQLLFERLLARDAHQTPRERFGTGRCPLYRAHLAFDAVEMLAPRKLHVGRDDHQQIIEVVRDIRDEIAERAHALQLTARRLDGQARRDFGLPALPRGLLGVQAADRERDQQPDRNARHQRDPCDEREIVAPARIDGRHRIACRDIERIVAHAAEREQPFDMVDARAHAHTAIELVVAKGVGEGRVRGEPRAVRARRIAHENTAVTAIEPDDDCAVARDELAIEVDEIAALQRDRHDPEKLPAVADAAHARGEDIRTRDLVAQG